MIRLGVSLARSVELTSQWDKILAVGPFYPVIHGDLVAVQGLGIGEFHGVVSDLHHRLNGFMRLLVIVVMMLFGGGGIGFGKIL